MPRARKVAAALLAITALAVTIAPAASADAKHKCAPGQHGNPHPAFKPGSC